MVNLSGNKVHIVQLSAVTHGRSGQSGTQFQEYSTIVRTRQAIIVYFISSEKLRR